MTVLSSSDLLRTMPMCLFFHDTNAIPTLAPIRHKFCDLSQLFHFLPELRHSTSALRGTRHDIMKNNQSAFTDQWCVKLVIFSHPFIAVIAINKQEIKLAVPKQLLYVMRSP